MLGDPLIKGLTEVSSKKPDDPVGFLAKYLHRYAETKSLSARTIQEVTPSRPFPRITLFKMNDGGMLKKKQEPIAEEIYAGDQERGLGSTPGNFGDGQSYTPPKDLESRHRVSLTAHPTIISRFLRDRGGSYTSSVQDKDGQTILHQAAARRMNRIALGKLLRESGISIAVRDSQYRTARDVAFEAGLRDNVQSIDDYVVELARRGESRDPTGKGASGSLTSPCPTQAIGRSCTIS